MNCQFSVVISLRAEREGVWKWLSVGYIDVIAIYISIYYMYVYIAVTSIEVRMWINLFLKPHGGSVSCEQFALIAILFTNINVSNTFNTITCTAVTMIKFHFPAIKIFSIAKFPKLAILYLSPCPVDIVHLCYHVLCLKILWTARTAKN